MKLPILNKDFLRYKLKSDHRSRFLWSSRQRFFQLATNSQGLANLLTRNRSINDTTIGIFGFLLAARSFFVLKRINSGARQQNKNSEKFKTLFEINLSSVPLRKHI